MCSEIFFVFVVVDNQMYMMFRIVLNKIINQKSAVKCYICSL
jgi:hypothetical protein